MHDDAIVKYIYALQIKLAQLKHYNATFSISHACYFRAYL